MRVIKAFNLESGRRQLVNESIAAVQQASNQMARITSRTGPLMEGLGGIAIAMVAAYGGYRVIEAGAKPGEFMSFLAAFVLAYEPAKRLSQINVTLSNSVVGAKLLFDTLNSPDTEPNDDDKAALAVRTGRIEFRDVRFDTASANRYYGAFPLPRRQERRRRWSDLRVPANQQFSVCCCDFTSAMTA